MRSASAWATASRCRGALAMLPADVGFWDYSVALYARPGVASACLALQDRHDLDVNLLLLCCWAGARGIQLDPGRLAALAAVVGPWQTEVVQALRRVRRRLKGDPLSAPAAAAEALRRQIGAVELEAERIEQTMLAAALGTSEGAASPAAAVANLAAYGRVAGVAWEAADAADLAVLLGGAFPELSEQERACLVAAIPVAGVA